MKVCAVGLRGIPGVMGGIEKHCEQIYPRIAELDSSLKLSVTGRSPYLSAKQSYYQDVEVVSLWAVRNKYLETILHTLLAIFYVRFVAKADVVHIHAIGPGLFAPLARLLGLKVLFTHHGADYRRQKWSVFAKTILWLGEWLAISASHTSIVVGSTLCEQLKQRFPKQAHKLVFIPNGADIGSMKNLASSTHPVLEQFGLKAGEYVLAVGRLVPEKGFQDLVKAFKQVDVPYKLVITGGSDHPDAFSRELLAEASERVVFTGFQSGAALASLFANAALFVLPSYHEGLPIVALEALGFERPVVLSNIDANLDIGLPAGCYFPVGNLSALAEKLLAADYNHYRVNTAQILARFNWDSIAKQTAEQIRAMDDRRVMPSKAGG
jgi:glycosyltransferase involved in cell wall biosynthesis